MNDKKERIMEESLKLFYEKGFDKTTTSEIAEKSEIAKGTLFNYFKTKKDLINQVYLYSKKKLIENTSNINEEDINKGLENLWNNLIDFGLNNPEVLNFLVSFNYYANKKDISQKELEIKPKHSQEFFKKIKSKYILKIPSELYFSYMMYEATAIIKYINEYPNCNISQLKEVSFDILCNGVFENKK